MARSPFVTAVSPTEILEFRKDKIPDDYHCECKYCTTNFIGEIFGVTEGKYYSQNARRKYYATLKEKHLCPGHWQGYRFAVQHFTKPGDAVFDPTVGTGTAIVEAINNGRNGIGIELEFPEVALANINHQRNNGPTPGVSVFIQGDARELDRLLNQAGIPHGSIQLVVNGTPYPKIGSKSSDAPQRKNFKTQKDESFDYEEKDSFGLLKGKEYFESITSTYLKCIPFMKLDGYFIIIIKDMVQNKQPFLLHKMIVDNLLAATDQLEYHGMFLHKHIPTTLFINTYKKMYPDAGKIPLYQTAIVLRKVK